MSSLEGLSRRQKKVASRTEASLRNEGTFTVQGKDAGKRLPTAIEDCENKLSSRGGRRGGSVRGEFTRVTQGNRGGRTFWEKMQSPSSYACRGGCIWHSRSCRWLKSVEKEKADEGLGRGSTLGKGCSHMQSVC